MEKRLSSREVRLQVAEEELVKMRDELKIMENANVQAQQELVYMKRLVDELTFKLKEAIDISMKDRLRANKMENASFTAAEDWQVELEAMEKQYQAEICSVRKSYEDLKLKFVAATNEKDEAVRLAGEAILAAEAAAKRAESLSVELKKAKALIAESNQEMRKFDQVLDELTKQKAELTEAYAACHAAAQAGAAMVAEKEAELKKQIATSFQAKHQAELLRWELFESRKKELKLCEMDNELEVLREKLAVAKEAEHQQAQIVMDTNTKLQKTNSEIHRAKVAESEAATLLTLAQVEVEDSQQKWRMACAEVGTLTATLESITSELESVQLQVWKSQEQESCAWAEAAASEAKLVEVTENLARSLEREQCKDETVSSLTSLLDEVEREAQRSRQQIYEAIFEAHFEAQKEMVKTEAAAKEEVLSLQKSLEVARSIAGEERIDFQVAIGELHLERARALVIEQHKDETVNGLTSLLDEVKREALILRQQIYEAIFEAHFEAQKEMVKTEAAAKEEVLSLQEALEVARSIAGEAHFDFQVAIGELHLARARALEREQLNDETVHGLTSLLDEVKREAEILRQHIYEAIFEARFEAQKEMVKTETAAKEEVLSLQKSLEVARSITGEARFDLQVAIGELHLARELAAVGPSVEHNTKVATIKCASAGLGVENGPNPQTMKASLESTEAEKESPEDQANILREALEASQAVSLGIATDLEVTRDELKVARAEAEVSNTAALEAVNKANCAKQEAEVAQKCLSAAREEVLAEREQVRHARGEALAAAAKIEQLQRELSKASENASGAQRETRDKSREFSEPWEMVESGSEFVTIRQEEYDALKLKVQEGEQFHVSIETEFQSLRCLNEGLSAQLDAANMEIKAVRMSEQNTWQQYDKAQQENLILEAEVQRLTSKGEQLLKAWEIGHEAFSSNANALHSPTLISMERKLQHESLQHSIYRDLSLSQKDEEEEESTEFPPLSTKKKKKALFLRIGTYLTKKMNP